jgi:RNA polymerase sigma factor (sigma-70 family)
MRTQRVSCVVAVLGCLVLPVDAMVAQTLRKPTTVVGNGYSTLPRIARPAESWTDAILDEDEYADDQDFLMDFMELQRSTGTEIPNEELQLQIDQATLSPDLFLDAHIQDASFMEKVAMSSIPQQLPRPAVTALSKKKKRSSKKTSILDLTFAHGRVTPEQEVQLGKMIQNGVVLHKKKMELEATLGREVTRQEWTDHVGLESPKELRRFVSEYRRAKQLLVTANMGLVHAVVKIQHSRKMGVTYEELVQEGSLGLLRAAELFDPSRGLRFSTYATIWIKGTLSNSHVVEPITLPQREKSKWNKIRKAHEELVAELDREPTPQEICTRIEMSVEEFLTIKRKMTQAQQVLSLDYVYNAVTRGGTAGDSFAGLQNDKAFMADVDLAERAQLHADIVAALARNLDAREARLMRLRYGLADGQTRSLAECAEAMGLGQTRVQQIAQKCLKKLREAEEMSSLEEYLLTIA